METVEIHTTVAEDNIQDLLKSYYNISYEEVTVAHLSVGHFKIQASPSVISKILNSLDNKPHTWTITPPTGYCDKDHITISITYSDDSLTGKLSGLPSVDFVQKLTQSGKLSYSCVITVQRIDQCVYYDFSCSPTQVKPLIKINVTGHGDADVSVNNSVQCNIRELIEEQFKNMSCWVVWIYNGNNEEYWKQIS